MKCIFFITLFYVSGCYAYSNGTISCTYSNSLLQVNLAQITVQRDHAINTPIGPEITVDENMSDCVCSSDCDPAPSGSVAVISNQADEEKKINSRTIYETNLPGVGYAIGINNHAWNDKLHWIGDSYDVSANSTHSSGQMLPLITASTVHIQLYKIGNMSSGLVTGNVGSLAGAIIVGGDGEPGGSGGTSASFASSKVPVNISSVPINVVKCQLNAAKMLFPVGDVPVDQFTGAGSTSQQTSTVNLALDCDQDANINITLTGTQNPDCPTNKSVLALSDQGKIGTAEGIGVQLLYNDSPIELDTILNLKRSAGGQESFPLTARYYQTRDSMKAGSANATAVLNLTYQ